MIESVKKPLRLKKRHLTKKQKCLHNFSLGHLGENQALEFLLGKNFRILDNNVRFGNSEVDIIALDLNHDELVFVEVKTRSSDEFGNPSHAVTRNKIRSMNYVANQYLYRSKLDYDYRFDIITITPNGIKHYENVTWG